MSSNPSTRIYWNDLQADLRRLSRDAQALWAGWCLALMEDAPERGKLFVDERAVRMDDPKSITILARHIGWPEEIVLQALEDIIDCGVASFESEEDWTIINRRMVREAEISRVRSEAGRRGGKRSADSRSKPSPSKSEAKPEANDEAKSGEPDQPDLLGGKGGSGDNKKGGGKQTRSKSRSKFEASSNLNTSTPPTPSKEIFESVRDEMWAAWPKRSRSRSSTSKLFDHLKQVWKDHQIPPDRVLEAFRRYLLQLGEYGRREEGQFIPGPEPFFNKRMWKDYLEPQAAEESPKQAPEDRWETRVAGFAKDGYWSIDWGPKPSDPDCKAPAAILKKHGFDA